MNTKYTDHLSEHEIQSIKEYVEHFLFNENDDMMVQLYHKKAESDADFYPALIQTYFNISCLFRSALNAVRKKEIFKFSSQIANEAKNAASTDNISCQELRIHMLDKILSIQPIQSYVLGKDVTEGEFIQVRKILDSYKLQYIQSR